jgi:hypothetical protein
MNITIANLSKVICAADFHAAVAAVGRQVTEHFQPEWGTGARLKGMWVPLVGKKAPIQEGADAVIYVGDSSVDPTTGVTDADGYHSANNKGIPYGFVYLDICAKAKEAWSFTLSHEVLELLADPDTALTVAGSPPKHAPKRVPGTVYYDLEVCDPTQGDFYLVDEVVVSNFVGRKYYGLSGGSGMTNYLNRPLRPFGVRPGGYLQYETGSTPHHIYGSRVTLGQKAAKKAMQNIRRNARRAERLASRKSAKG